MRGNLGVRIVTATRDQHVTKRVRSLTFEASAPGGGTTASMTLRMARDDWPDIVGARLFIYDAATATAIWDGWIDNPGDAYDDTEAFELTAQGPSILAQQRSRALWYIDTGFDNFTDSYVYDVGWRVQGASESVGDVPSLTENTETDPDDAEQAVVAQMPSGTVIGSRYFCGMYWAGAEGTEMRGRAFSFISKAGFGGDPNWLLRVAGWGGNLDRQAATAEATQAQVTPASFGGLKVYLRHHAGGGTTIPNDNYWGAFSKPLLKAELMDRWGRVVVPTLDPWWPLSAIVEDLAGRMITDVDPDLTTIDETPYQIDQLMYPEGTRAAAVLEDLLKFEPAYSWAIDAVGSPSWGRGFHWFKLPTTPRFEITETDGVEFPGGDNDVATEAVVFWTDPKAGYQRRRRTIKTADPLSTAWEYSGSRTMTADPITLDENKGSAANADRAAQIVLDTHEAPTRAGSAIVARNVRDLQTGAQVSPWTLHQHVGELVRVRESGEVLPMTAVSYADDERAASLTLGWPVQDMDDLLADIPTTS